MLSYDYNYLTYISSVPYLNSHLKKLLEILSSKSCVILGYWTVLAVISATRSALQFQL